MSTLRRPGSPQSAALYSPSPASIPAEGFINSNPWIPYPVTRSPFLAQGAFVLRAGRSLRGITCRRREMTPADQKDDKYRDKRLKNNEAAKRSREKRKLGNLLREAQLLELKDENARLRAQLLSLQHLSGLRASGRRGSGQSSLSFLFQRPGLAGGDGWSHRGSSAAARQRLSDHFGAQSPCLGPSQGVSEPKSSHMHGIPRLFPPPPLGAHSHAAMFEGGGRPDPEQYPVFGIHPRASLSSPEEAIFPSPVPMGWLPPYRPALRPNPLLIPCPPLHMRGVPDRLLGVNAPSHLSQLDMKLSSGGP